MITEKITGLLMWEKMKNVMLFIDDHFSCVRSTFFCSKIKLMSNKKQIRRGDENLHVVWEIISERGKMANATGGVVKVKIYDVDTKIAL